MSARASVEFKSSLRKDFAEGAVVIVAGWVLSETEAQLYALAALASDC